MNKQEGAKELIKFADSIFEDYLKNNRLKFKAYDEDELKRKINQYSILCAQICEYYLKALILPNLRSEAFENDSEEEMHDLAVSKSGLKKYSHVLHNMLNSSNLDKEIQTCIKMYLFNNLPHIEAERNEIINQLFGDTNINQIFEKCGAMISLNESSYTSISGLLKQIDGEHGLILNNSNAYVESRYSMISDYKADLKFLSYLCDAIRSSLNLKFKNCIEVGGCSRHIFPDVNTDIYVFFTTGNIRKFVFGDDQRVYITNDDGQLEDVTTSISNFDRVTQNKEQILYVMFTENGKEKLLAYDSDNEVYYFSNENINGLKNMIGDANCLKRKNKNIE